MREAGLSRSSSAGDPRTVFLFFLHLLSALALIPFFPGQVADPDLYAYFLYFGDIIHRAGGFVGMDYLNHPKPLMIFLLGPLGSPYAAAIVSAFASAWLGSTVYLIGREAFGSAAGLLWSLLLLVDPTRIFLALKSGADLYLTLFLFLSILLCLRGKPGRASAALLIAALIKPVVLPCAAQLILGPGRPFRRLRNALVPFSSLPLTLLVNHLLTGSAWLPGTYLAEFAQLRGTAGIAAPALPGFIFWQVLVENRFGLLMIPAIAGMAIWTAGGTSRLRSPLLLMPFLFCAGYLGLALLSPYLPFFRFFWPLDVWLLGFIAFAAARAWECRKPKGRLPAAALASAIIALTITTSLQGLIRYHVTFALPMERDRAAAREGSAIIGQTSAKGQTVMCPLGLQSFLMWRMAIRGVQVVSAEGALQAGSRPSPDWILDIPTSYLNPSAASLADGLKRSGNYEIAHSSASGAVYRRMPAEEQGPGRK